MEETLEQAFEATALKNTIKELIDSFEPTENLFSDGELHQVEFDQQYGVALLAHLMPALVPKGIDTWTRYTYGDPREQRNEHDYSATIGDGRPPFKKVADGKILVKKLDPEEFTATGFKIPDNHAEKPTQGLIVQIGAGLINEKTGERQVIEAQKGEKVLFQKFAGADIRVYGVEYKIIEEKDVLAYF